MFKPALLFFVATATLSSCAFNPDLANRRLLTPAPTSSLHDDRATAEQIAITNPNAILRADENWTVLHQAADDQDFSLVRMLVANGADPRTKARWKYLAGGYGPYDQTPAMVALRWGRTDIAQFLTAQSGEDYERIAQEARIRAAKGRAQAMKDFSEVMDQARKLDRMTSY